MQFHDYVTLRNQWVRQSHDPRMQEIARSMNAAQFRQLAMGLPNKVDLSRRDSQQTIDAVNQYFLAATEEAWVKADRPYYNFWPVAVELARQVRLDTPWSSVKFPFASLLLRFAVGHEPCSIGVAMIQHIQERDIFAVDAWIANSSDAYRTEFNKCGPNESVEDILASALAKGFDKDWTDNSRPSQEREATTLMIRLAIFVSLLSRDTDLITPIVLAKDSEKHASADDASVKQWLEDRAARRLGRGFDVGKQLQAERENSPHWRNPHLCLFWTDKGRMEPVIKTRRGAVIQRVSMADVPTGHFGPETSAEDQIRLRAERVAISVRKRFEVFKRDGYCCRLCGARADVGAALHVDHRVPVAKGGGNDDDNLWTLCDQCNLGKSDLDL